MGLGEFLDDTSDWLTRLADSLGGNTAVLQGKPANPAPRSNGGLAADGERLLGVQRLIGQVDALVREAGEPGAGFDAARWFARWMADPVAALGGLAPQQLLDTADGREAVSTRLYQMTSGA